MPPKNYERDVFINCPFDDGYMPMFDAILYVLYECGFRPRCAREIDDSGQVRMDKIFKLIKECKYGIHDISRTEVDGVYQLPRFNMPLELGIFIGATKFGGTLQRTKRAMIVDVEQYRYQKFISDIAGQDIKSHGNDPEKIITIIRNWLRAISQDRLIPGGSAIVRRYNDFKASLPGMCRDFSVEPGELTYNDKSQLISVWLTTNPPGHIAA